MINTVDNNKKRVYINGEYKSVDNSFKTYFIIKSKTCTMKKNKKRVNPYTQIAILHNHGIDYVFKKLKDKHTYNEEISFETILEATSEYMAKIQSDKSEAKKAVNYAILVNMFNMDRGKFIDEMLEKLNIPMPVIGYLEDVRKLDETLQSNELIKQIADIESELLATDYSNEEIKFVLLYIAIAKGSVKDWQLNHNLRFPKVHDEYGSPWKEDAESAMHAALLIGPFDFVITGSVLTVASVVGGSVVASTKAIINRRRK